MQGQQMTGTRSTIVFSAATEQMRCKAGWGLLCDQIEMMVWVGQDGCQLQDVSLQMLSHGWARARSLRPCYGAGCTPLNGHTCTSNFNRMLAWKK